MVVRWFNNSPGMSARASMRVVQVLELGFKLRTTRMTAIESAYTIVPPHHLSVNIIVTFVLCCVHWHRLAVLIVPAFFYKILINDHLTFYVSATIDIALYTVMPCLPSLPIPVDFCKLRQLPIYSSQRIRT
jgi:hypothetical protein